MKEINRRDIIRAGILSGISLVGARMLAADEGKPKGATNPPVLFPVGKDNKFGFINAKGELVVPLKYKRVGSFADYRRFPSDGLAVVATEEGQGYIDETGKEVIPPTLYFAGSFTGGLAHCRLTKTKEGYLRRDGSVAFEPTAPTRADWGPFVDGLAPVHYGGINIADHDEWGFIDTTGKMVIRPVFRRAEPFFDGFALVSMSSELESPFYIDKTGRVAFSAAPGHRTALDAASFSEGLAAVKWFHVDGDAWSFINTEGKEAFKKEFAETGYFSEGVAAVKSLANGKWGYINKAGETAIDYKFTAADEFSEGLAAVQVDDGKRAIIDKTGAFIMEPQSINGFFGLFSGGLLRVMAEGLGSDRYLDRMGKTIWPKE